MSFGPLTVRFDDRVLRPRLWTLAQSMWAAEFLHHVPDGPVLELCAGVGHIGLALAAVSDRHIVLVDGDRTACDYAIHNAEVAGLTDQVSVRHGPIQDVIAPNERFALVLADPPWVPSADVSQYPADPRHAIDGGPDGLELARLCVTVISRHLAGQGASVLQLGNHAQAELLDGYLKARPALDLEVMTVRSVPDAAGVLLHLARPGGAASVEGRGNGSVQVDRAADPAEPVP